jgi:hypothetical protein
MNANPLVWAPSRHFVEETTPLEKKDRLPDPRPSIMFEFVESSNAKGPHVLHTVPKSARVHVFPDSTFAERKTLLDTSETITVDEF